MTWMDLPGKVPGVYSEGEGSPWRFLGWKVRQMGSNVRDMLEYKV